MRIATWNIERLKHKKSICEIEQACNNSNADILVLTETDSRIHIDFPYVYYSPSPSAVKPDYYAKTEHRIAIYTKAPCVSAIETYDPYTALCIELETKFGVLTVYGTIMGVFGNRNSSFLPDVKRQMADNQNLKKLGKKICICGDYNLSFCDNYYFTTKGRVEVQQTFEQCGITIITAELAECIDHIAVSNELIERRQISLSEWNHEKTLSDHKGVVAEITE